MNPEALHHAEVEAHQPRRVRDQAADAAVTVAGRGLDAVRTVGGCEIAAGRRAERAVAVGRRRAGLERLHRVVDDVLRQDEQLAVRRDPQLDRLAEFILRHADQAHVAEVDLLAGLDAADAVELPSAQQRVHHTARVSAPPLAFAEGQLVEPVALERMLHVADLAGLRDLGRRPREAVALHHPGAGPRVAGVEREAVRQPLAELELNRIRARATRVRGQVGPPRIVGRAAEHVGVREEKVRRQAGGDAVGAERGIADEAVGRIHRRKAERVRVHRRQEAEVRGIGELRARVIRRVAGLPGGQPLEERQEDRQRRRARRAGVGERRGAASGDVGLKVRLRLPELLQEPVIGDAHLIDVHRFPVLPVTAADVAHFERRVVGQLALPADRVRLRVRHLQVRVEDVQAVGDRRRDRIRHRRRRRQRQRAGVAEQHRERAEVAGGRVAVQRDRDAAVVAERAGEVRHAGTVESHRPAAADDAVAFLRAEDQPADRVVLARHLPRRAGARREVVAIGIEGVGARRVLDQRRLRAGQHAGLEDVVHARHAVEARQRRRRVAVVGRVERILEHVAQAGAHREVRRGAPGVGRVEVELAHASFRARRTERHVRVAFRRDARIAGQRGDAAGQDRIEALRVGQVGRRRARKVRRAEHPGGCFRGEHAEIRRRHQRLVL